MFNQSVSTIISFYAIWDYIFVKLLAYEGDGGGGH